MISQVITDEQKKKIDTDLQFISLINQVGKQLGYRVIIAGGYAVDAALGQITRPHNDMDIQIYGKDNDGLAVVHSLLSAVAKKAPQFTDYSVEDKVHKEYYRNLYVKIEKSIADIYYLQTQNNPFDNHKEIIKKDGTVTEPHIYETKKLTLNNIEFEAQDPLTEVADKIYKRDFRGDPKLEKHEQDILNLRNIVEPQEIEAKLKKQK